MLINVLAALLINGDRVELGFLFCIVLFKEKALALVECGTEIICRIEFNFVLGNVVCCFEILKNFIFEVNLMIFLSCTEVFLFNSFHSFNELIFFKFNISKLLHLGIFLNHDISINPNNHNNTSRRYEHRHQGVGPQHHQRQPHINKYVIKQPQFRHNFLLPFKYVLNNNQTQIQKHKRQEYIQWVDIGD